MRLTFLIYSSDLTSLLPHFLLFFFFNDTATTEIYTLSLHDALPISPRDARAWGVDHHGPVPPRRARAGQDRKSTRLNSSHGYISYAVFCLKKKKNLREKIGTSSRSASKLRPAPDPP